MCSSDLNMTNSSIQSDNFYALTTLRKREDDIEYRKIGIFKTIKDIHKLLELDVGGGMTYFETGFFPWALIEECPYGLYMYSYYEEWWTHQDGLWIPYRDGDHTTPLQFLGDYRWVEI